MKSTPITKRLLELALPLVVAATQAACFGDQQSPAAEHLRERSSAVQGFWKARTLSGDAWDLADSLGSSTRGHLAVLLFVADDCPISNRYAPRLNDLSATFSPRGAAFFAVYDAATHTPTSARQHLETYALEATGLLDTGALRQLAEIAVTPEAALISAEGALLYRGRIDNWYEDFGRRRPTPTQHDLELAIEAALQDEAVAQPWPRAVGCSVSSPE